MVLALIFNLFVAGVMQYFFGKMLSYKDKRVALITDMIECMKSIKYLSWEKIFEKKIQKIRRGEFGILCLWRGSEGVLGIFWNSLRMVL